MAGISFKLRKILKKDTITSLLQVYGYGAIVTAGGWVTSIITILLVGLLHIFIYKNSKEAIDFQIIVTYLISISLLVSSFHHLVFTRFVADKIYENEDEKIVPNYFGMFILNTLISLFVIIVISFYLLAGLSLFFKVVFIFTFLVLSNIWILNILAVSIKKFEYVGVSYLVSYSFIVVSSLILGKFGLIYMLISFFLGNAILFLLLFYLVVKNYIFYKLLSFEFLDAYKKYWKLIFISFLFNGAIWIPEFMFWYNKETSEVVLGNIHSSIIYDLPISLAYLTILPGLAIFFVRLETDFADAYDDYFGGIVEGSPLSSLIKYKNIMVQTIRVAIKEAIILQGFFNLIILLLAKKIFNLLQLPLSSLPLFYIDVVETQLQLLTMNMLAFLFYLDRRNEAFVITFAMFFFNYVFTYVTIQLGPYYYGYGAAFAMLISSVIALLFLNRVFERLEYETFMLQN